MWGVVGSSVIALLQILSWFWQWKKVWNLVNIRWGYKAYKNVLIFGPPVDHFLSSWVWPWMTAARWPLLGPGASSTSSTDKRQVPVAISPRRRRRPNRQRRSDCDVNCIWSGKCIIYSQSPSSTKQLVCVGGECSYRRFLPLVINQHCSWRRNHRYSRLLCLAAPGAGGWALAAPERHKTLGTVFRMSGRQLATTRRVISGKKVTHWYSRT